MSIKLVVLGLLMEEPRHPYEMQQIFKQRKMERYINFQKGSLYYAVNKLGKKDLITIEKITKESNRQIKQYIK